MGKSEYEEGDIRPERIRTCARISARQFGVISRDQLRANGVTEHAIKRWLSSGILHRVHRGVYAFGNPGIVAHGRLFSALLAAGKRAFLSHRTAAALYGLRNLNLRRIELTVVAASTRGCRGLILHRTTRNPARQDITLRTRLRVSSVSRMLVELAAREKQEELERLLTEAARRQLLDPHALARALERHAGRPGIGRLREVSSAYLPGPDRTSDLERDFDRVLAQHPEIPQPQRNVIFGGWEIDCFWPAQGLAVELDGRPYHVAVRDLERDRLKDAQLLRLGIRPMRITDRRFGLEPHQVLREVGELVALGEDRLTSEKPLTREDRLTSEKPPTSEEWPTPEDESGADWLRD